LADVWDEKAVFLVALALAPEDRDAFLDGACKTPEQLVRIETLLRKHAEADSNDADPATSEDLGDKQFDEFKVIHTLGSGGMGVVYLAEDTLLKRKVALKVLAEHMTGSESALARFRTEARAAASIKHPGVVPVFRFGFTRGRHYLVSEYVEGPTLAAVIREQKETREAHQRTEDLRTWHRRCAEIIAQVADALDHSHRAGIVHRDVKPSNIILDPVAGPRLTDFGIAKHLTEEDRTQATSLVGSCHYMSPEQASVSSTTVDQRSDVFSLGVVLYEMLTLRRPFEGDDPFRVLRAIISEEPARPRSIDPQIPRDLETICRKAIEKSRINRYQSAAHFAADLRCYLEGKPILARPPSLGRQSLEFGRRHRRPLLAAVMALLVVSIAVAVWKINEIGATTVAWVSVESDAEASTVYLQEHNAETHAVLEASRKIGLAPIDSLSLAPGQYRLTIVRDSDGAFCEFNLVLTELGKANLTRVRAADAADEGVLAGAEAPLLGLFRPTDEVVSEDMLQIAGGAYDLRGVGPEHPVLQNTTEVEPFYIDAREVTNRQYKEFVDATGHREPYFCKEWGYTQEIADLPVIWVSMADAEAYARFRGKRLPTVLEWQAAARGVDGRLYPWGDDLPDEDVFWAYMPNGTQIGELFASYKEHVAPASQPAPWDPPLGMLHTYSNVRELTGTADPGGDGVYLAGRAWTDDPSVRTLALESTFPLSQPSPRMGFRCAKSAAPVKE
jgi:serine/threonine protein kinase/formylglycine-generating enzyme required for sulfatase activity